MKRAFSYCSYFCATSKGRQKNLKAVLLKIVFASMCYFWKFSQDTARVPFLFFIDTLNHIMLTIEVIVLMVVFDLFGTKSQNFANFSNFMLPSL